MRAFIIIITIYIINKRSLFLENKPSINRCTKIHALLCYSIIDTF